MVLLVLYAEPECSMCSVILGCEFLCRRAARAEEKREDNFLCMYWPNSSSSCSMTKAELDRRPMKAAGMAAHLLRRRPTTTTTTATMIYRLPTVPTPNWLPPLATLLQSCFTKGRTKLGGSIHVYSLHTSIVYLLCSTKLLFFCPKLFWQMLENAAFDCRRRCSAGCSALAFVAGVNMSLWSMAIHYQCAQFSLFRIRRLYFLPLGLIEFFFSLFDGTHIVLSKIHRRPGHSGKFGEKWSNRFFCFAQRAFLTLYCCKISGVLKDPSGF